MREIKFRAMSMCKGEHWLYGDLRHYSRNSHTEKWTIHDPNTGIETDIDETTIGQFIGLYDKNGKEIYEGDIISDGSRMYAIVWFEKASRFVCINKNGLYICGFMNQSEMKEFGVIGDVHNNQELLK